MSSLTLLACSWLQELKPFNFQLVESKKLLEDLTVEISQFTKDIPLSVLRDILSSVDQVHNTILSVSPEVEFAEGVR